MIQAQDPFGHALSLQRAGSAAAVGDFVEGFLGYTPRILAVLGAAEHDHSLIVQACAAVLHLFAESPAGVAPALAHLDRAAQAGLPCTERERLFASAIRHWAQGDLAAARAVHAELAASYPRDLAAHKLGQYHAFNAGDSPALLRLALQALPAAHEVAWAHGMVAFGWEQCHRLDEAERAARRALAMRPVEPWAQHALAHVMLTDGRLSEGAAVMRSAGAAASGWHGLTSFMRTHLWWHLALFEIELGREAQALALYDSQVWGVDKTYSQDQVGAVSLLARLELAGLDVGPRWDELAGWLRARIQDQVQPFLDLQYLYGLARAAAPEADRMQSRIERHAAMAPAHSRLAWQRVAVPAGRGLLAHARGQWALAAEHLGAALPQLAAIGGSHAQRDLFEQIHLDALQRSGQLASAHNLLQPRANAHQQSMRLRRRVDQLNAGLGLPA